MEICNTQFLHAMFHHILYRVNEMLGKKKDPLKQKSISIFRKPFISLPSLQCYIHVHRYKKTTKGKRMSKKKRVKDKSQPNAVLIIRRTNEFNIYWINNSWIYWWKFILISLIISYQWCLQSHTSGDEKGFPGKGKKGQRKGQSPKLQHTFSKMWFHSNPV